MRSIHRILALAGALAIAAPSLPAFAQNAPTRAQQQEAATRFKKGLELFKDGDYQAALIEFRRANELAPNFNVLYNIGQVYFQLQDYPNALNALERYMSEGSSNIPSSRRADVQRDIDKLRARVANVEIVVTVPDADVAIDDVVIGKSPLPKPIMVSAGRHKITISKTGFTATTKLIEIASGDSLKLPIDPVEQKAAPIVVAPVDPNRPPDPVNVTPPPDVPVIPPPPPPRPVPVAGIVVTSGLVIGSVITGVLALGAKSSLQDEVKSPTATRDSLDSAHGKVTGFALATDILAGSAVVALGVTLYVGLSGPSKKDAPAAAAPHAGAFFTPTARLAFGADGIKLLGTF
jgi:hypothetical protein